ncbi:MAG: glycosyltransferase [Treponema sp.]
MKILFIVSTLQMGGAERVLVELANRWAERHSISVLTLDAASDFFKLKEKVNRFRLDIVRKNRKNPIPHIKMLFGIRCVAKKVKPDYVISFVGKTNVFTLLALNSKKYKIIVGEHSIITQDDADKFVDLFRLRLYQKAYKATVLTDRIKKDFLARYTKCQEENVIVTPNALNIPTQIQKNNLNLKDICNVKTESTKIITALGRFDEVKRFDLLIKIFAQFYKTYCNTNAFDARLILFGGGGVEDYERQNYIDLILKLNMQEKVFIHERVSDVFSVLSQADVYACTSRYEGFGMSILEAFYVKIPVIAFDVSGIEELAINEKTAILVEDNKIENYVHSLYNILTNQELCEKIVNNAKDKVENYLPEKIDEIWFNKVLI